MTPLVRQIALNAEHWLEHTLLPLALAAARVPGDLPLEGLLQAAEAEPDSKNASYPLACMFAEQRPRRPTRRRRPGPRP
jgi:hypothetical protein